VIFDDGTPAPSGVAIECVGTRARQAVTNSKGRFSFVLGRSKEAVYDASDNGYYSVRLPGQPHTPYSGAPSHLVHPCDLQAHLSGYRSTKLLLAGFERPLGPRPEGGTIILKPIGEVSGHTVSATTLQAPEKARKAFDHGVTNAQAGKFKKAEKELRKAVEIYPAYSEAWFHLGQVCEVQNKQAEARQAYQESISADSRFASPYLRLAMMDTREARWEAVAEATEQVIKMNPYDFPDAFYLNAVANLNMNQLVQAAKRARQAIEMNAWKKYPQVEHILGVALAHLGQHAEAKTHLKRYLEIYPDAANAEVVEMQLAQVESVLAGQTRATGPSVQPWQATRYKP
jgi:tetratricopeptide (TPR) repeat protein